MGWLSTLGKLGATVGASMIGSPALGAAVYGGLSAAGKAKAANKAPAGGGGDAGGGGWADTAASVLGGLGNAGQVAGATAGGSAQGRAQESALLDARDRTATDRYQAEQAAQNQAAQTDLQRKNFTETNRGSRARQAAVADILANFKGTQINIPGIASANVTGGMQMGDGAKQAMGKLREQALLAQLQGDSPDGEKFTGGAMLKPQALSQAPEASGMDKAMGALGTIGSFAGALGPQFAELLARKQYDVGAGPQAPPAAQAGLGAMPGEDVGMPMAPPDPRAGLMANQKRLGQNVSL
jgi:hypothetical protein